MSEDTNNPEVVEDPGNPEVADDSIVGDVELIQGRRFPLKETFRTKKNSEEKYSLYRLVIEPAELLGLLSAKLNDGGNHVLEGCILREIVYPACNEATAAALKVNPETGQTEFSEEVFINTFWDAFVPSDRRRTGGGVTVKELRERLSAIMPEFTKAVTANTDQEKAYVEALELAVRNRTAPPTKSEYVKESDLNRVAQLLLEVNQLTAQIEAKSRPGGGRPRGKSKKAKAKAAK